MNKYLETIEQFQKDAHVLKRDVDSVEELKRWLKKGDEDEEGLRVVLGVDTISDELYSMLLQAFKEQFGNGYYDDWTISATKNSEN